MFKKAVESHDAAAQRKSLANQLFSSSPTTPSTTQAKPMTTTTANGINSQTVTSGSASHAGVKRSASGLAKALTGQDAFDAVTYPLLGSTVNGQGKSTGTTASEKILFDENDFESDIDLDVETPGNIGTVAYPPLPAQAPISRLNVSPTAARRAPHATSTSSQDDSGYQSMLTAKYSPPNAQVDSSAPLAWSSSPLEHFKTPSIGRFAYDPTLSTSQQAAKFKPSKRRTLPWLSEQHEQESKEATHSADQSKSKTVEETPSAKDPSKEQFPWNTTASAIKAQQKKFRESNTNKKLTNTHEANEGTKVAANSKRKREKIPKVFLSEEQIHVRDLVVNKKKSVFFTGSAGTGKSVLLREIIGALRQKYIREPDRVAVTASTGLAACNIGGVTLHSFAGIGLGKEEAPQLVRRIRKNQKARHRWMRTKVLVVDEISMVDGELFDKLEEIARTIRNNGRPFGGIQVVITGDFFQLPPVPDNSKGVARFCFDAHSWNTVVEHTIGLKHIFRQKDPEFASMLNEMREGHLTPTSIVRFKSLSRPLHFDDDLDATELFPTRAEVDEANMKRMRNLQGDTRVFEARDGGTIQDKSFRDKLLANCMAPEVIILKKGAQVMLIKNVDETLVNGSLGRVIGFMSEASFDNYQRNEEEYYATQANPDDAEATGPAELSERKLKLQELMASTAQIYPLVRFVLPDGTTRELLAQRETWKVELPSGEVQASRSQIPLILAWALSIHKAQGQTLERVKVDLRKVFEKGQAYVALSRATSMAGLQVMSFDPSKVLAHDRVRKFYAGLSRAEKEMKEHKDEGAGERPVKKAKTTAGGGAMDARAYEESLADMPAFEDSYDVHTYDDVVYDENARAAYG